MRALRPWSANSARSRREADTATHGTLMSIRASPFVTGVSAGAAAVPVVPVAPIVAAGAGVVTGVGAGTTGIRGAGTAVTSQVTGALALPAASVAVTVTVCAPS